MARTSDVTFERVATAADAMWAKGINPTVDLIRTELGPGSPGTVTPLLKLWRQQHSAKSMANATTPVTPEVVAAIQAWGNALLVAEREIHAEAIFAVQANLVEAENKASLLAAELAAERASVAELEESKSQRDAQLISAQIETQELMRRLAKTEHEKVEAGRELENVRRQIAVADQRAALAEQKAELIVQMGPVRSPKGSGRVRAS